MGVKSMEHGIYMCLYPGSLGQRAVKRLLLLSFRQITTPVPHHSTFRCRMPFLSPNQQRQSTEGTCNLAHGPTVLLPRVIVSALKWQRRCRWTGSVGTWCRTRTLRCFLTASTSTRTWISRWITTTSTHRTTPTSPADSSAASRPSRCIVRSCWLDVGLCPRVLAAFCIYNQTRRARALPFPFSLFVHSLPYLLLFFTFAFFLFLFALSIFFFYPSLPFLPE